MFCVGRNYMDHIAEGDKAQNKKIGVTEYPVYFTKPLTAVIGPGAAVPIFKHVSEAIDYEVELAIVIGKPGRDIPKERAYEHVFGYTILNDISARDVQRRHGGQYFKGKGLDGSCPIGPWIVTADAVSDPGDLVISSSVNGEPRQNGNTKSMIFDIPTLIASLSEGNDTGTRRYPRDRNSRRSWLRDGSAPLSQGRRYRRLRDRRDRPARESGPVRIGSGVLQQGRRQ